MSDTFVEAELRVMKGKVRAAASTSRSKNTRHYLWRRQATRKPFVDPKGLRKAVGVRVLYSAIVTVSYDGNED